MNVYRLYLRGRAGSVLEVRMLPAPSDHAAIEQAAQAGGGGAMELWHGPRRVKVFAAPVTGGDDRDDPALLRADPVGGLRGPGREVEPSRPAPRRSRNPTPPARST